MPEDKKLSEDEKEYKYVDIDLSYRFESQTGIDNMIKAINAFVELHKDGLQRSNINILGYSYY